MNKNLVVLLVVALGIGLIFFLSQSREEVAPTGAPETEVAAETEVKATDEDSEEIQAEEEATASAAAPVAAPVAAESEPVSETTVADVDEVLVDIDAAIDADYDDSGLEGQFDGSEIDDLNDAYVF